jgi:hypothetical protein
MFDCTFLCLKNRISQFVKSFQMIDKFGYYSIVFQSVMVVLNDLLTLYNPLKTLSISQLTIDSVYRPSLMLEEYVIISSTGHVDPKIF